MSFKRIFKKIVFAIYFIKYLFKRRVKNLIPANNYTYILYTYINYFKYVIYIYIFI